MFYSSTHKSEIPHTGSASVDVRTLNRVKDKIFSPWGHSNSLFFSQDRWAFVERERRGGWWVFRASERGALLKLFWFYFFPLTPLLPFHSFLLTLCSHLCISFSFFPRRDGWWVEHDFQRQNITGLSDGAALRVIETAVSGRLYLNWLQHT